MKNGHRARRRVPAARRPRRLPCLALLVALPTTCLAVDLEYEFGVSAVHSDNIDLGEYGGLSDTVLAPHLRFALERRGSAVKLEARGEIEHRNYLENTYSNEWRGEIAAQLDWSIVPQHVDLVLEDYLSHQPVDLGVGLSPGNVQRVNVFIGGPSFHARFNDATRFQLDLRAANSHAEVSRDFNGERYSAAARLQRELGPTHQASLNVVATRADFDEAGGMSDFSREDAYVGYRREYARGLMEFELGRSRLRPEAGGGTESAGLARASVTWTPTARSRLHADARYQLADSTQDLIVRQADLNDFAMYDMSASGLQVNADVYRQKRFALDYRYRGERLEVRLRPRYRSQRYLEDTGNDHEDYSGQVEIGYRVRPRLTLSLQALALRREFPASGRKDRDRTYGIEAEYRWTRQLSLLGGVYRNTRDSNNADFEYSENVASIAMLWRR